MLRQTCTTGTTTVLERQDVESGGGERNKTEMNVTVHLLKSCWVILEVCQVLV